MESYQRRIYTTQLKVLQSPYSHTSMLLALLWLLLASCYCQQSSQLVYVQEVFRHGARYPLHPRSEDNSTYAKGHLGELTKEGKSMHYVLGNQLFKEYWDRLFPGVREYNQSKIYVKSTDVDRTIQSAQAHLLGLMENLTPLQITEDEVPYSMPSWQGIPPRKAGKVFTNSPQFHSIPIHVEKETMTPWNRGDFLVIHNAAVCPKQNDWVKQNHFNPKLTPIINDPTVQQAIEALNQEMRSNLSFWGVSSYVSTATAQRYSSRPTLQVLRPNSTYYDTFYFIESVDLYARLFLTQKQLAATSTGFFNQTMHDFKRIERDTSGVQLVIYSAHDTTTANFLARLNLTNVDCLYDNFKQGRFHNNQSETCVLQFPAYASNLIFQVHKYQHGTHVMRIRYNGLYRRIPFCGYEMECTLDQYYQWYDSWKDEAYEETCGVTDSYKQEASVYFALMVVFIAVVLCLGVYYIVKRLENKQKENVVPVNNYKSKEPDNVEGRLKESMLSHDGMAAEV